MSYSAQQRQTLLELAHYSIAQGLATKKALVINHSDYDPELQLERACFVTLHLNGQLRGCIGSLQARRSLVDDVAENAFAAAFRDPRFNPLQPSELASLNISISVLTAAEPMSFNSEEDLIQQLKPDIDGLILQDGNRRGTFLPSVWEQLPTPREFLQHLKHKAGLPADYWSDTLQVSRYTTEIIE
jgi:uncharacterized protein